MLFTHSPALAAVVAELLLLDGCSLRVRYQSFGAGRIGGANVDVLCDSFDQVVGPLGHSQSSLSCFKTSSFFFFFLDKGTLRSPTRSRRLPSSRPQSASRAPWATARMDTTSFSIFRQRSASTLGRSGIMGVLGKVERPWISSSTIGFAIGARMLNGGYWTQSSTRSTFP